MDLPPRPEHAITTGGVGGNEGHSCSTSSQITMDSPRSIDDFFDEAHEKAPKSCRLRYWLVFLAMGIANCGDATEVISVSYIISDKRFQDEMLENDFKHNGAILASTIYAGMLVGGIVMGAYGDKESRKLPLLLGLFLSSLSGILGAITTSITALSFTRFCAGVGIGAVLSSNVALTSELSPPGRRGLIVAYVASFWTFGALCVSLIAWLVLGRYGDQFGWRWLVLLCSIPGTLALFLVTCFVPESPRVLAMRGEYEAAALNANFIANGMGYRGLKLHKDEVRHHFSSAASDGKVKGHDTSTTISDDSSKNTTDLKKKKKKEGGNSMAKSSQAAVRNVRDLFSEGIWNITVSMQLLWFAKSFGSGISTWIVQLFAETMQSDLYLNAFLFALASVPGNIVSALLLDRIGRKRMLLSSLFFSALCLLSFAMATERGHAPYFPHQIIVSTCCFHFFLVCTKCTVAVMTGELFPTRVRSTAMGVCSASGRVGSILSQFVNGALVHKPSVLLLVSSVSLVVSGGIAALPKVGDMAMQPLQDRLPKEQKKIEEERMKKELGDEEQHGIPVSTSVELV